MPPMQVPDGWHKKSETTARPLRVLVSDADSAVYGLLEDWLAAQGCSVVREHAGHDGVDLIVVNVPYPREGEQRVLSRVAREHPGIPILALSSNFFPSIDCCGAVARALGVAGVLPMPVTRDALAQALDRILKPKK